MRVWQKNINNKTLIFLITHFKEKVCETYTVFVPIRG